MRVCKQGCDAPIFVFRGKIWNFKALSKTFYIENKWKKSRKMEEELLKFDLVSEEYLTQPEPKQQKTKTQSYKATQTRTISY